MATANLFTNAKVIEGKKSAGKKTATKVLVEGLESYSAIDHMIKSLSTTLATAKTAVLEVVTAAFIERGSAESFDGEEGKGSGNIQCKKRSSASGLNDAEQGICTEYGIPTETVSDRPEGFLINLNDPAAAAWIQKNAVKLSAFCIKNGAPENLITKQEATTKVVTTDESLPYLFRTYRNHPEVVAIALPVVATLAIKPKFDGDDEAALTLIADFEA